METIKKNRLIITEQNYFQFYDESLRQKKENEILNGFLDYSIVQ